LRLHQKWHHPAPNVLVAPTLVDYVVDLWPVWLS